MDFLNRIFGKFSDFRSKLASALSADGLYVPPQFEADIEQAEASEQRYMDHGDRDGLDEAIVAWQRIMNHPNFPATPKRFRVAVLNDGGSVFLRRYWAQGNITDLNQALAMFQKAVAWTPPDSNVLPMCLNSLGNGLSDLYAHRGTMTDLEAAIAAYQEAVRLTPPDSPDLPMYLNNLGISLRDRYVNSGLLTDIEEAISVHQDAVQGLPLGSPDLPMYLNNLACGLLDRYAYSGQLADLEEAIAACQNATAQTLPGSPDLPMCLSNLGNGLRKRYARSNQLTDLNEAITVYQNAAERTPPNSPELFIIFNNLGNGLRDRYLRNRQLTDLEAAVSAYHNAIAQIPSGSPTLPSILNNLGLVFSAHYEYSGTTDFLETAITMYEEAVKRTPTHSQDRAARLNNLGTGLSARYAHSGQLTDLEKAIAAYDNAVKHIPPDSPDLPGYFNNLGNGFSERYTCSGQMADLEEAIGAYRQAVYLGKESAPGDASRAVRNWLRWAFERQSWSEVVSAYDHLREISETRLALQFQREDKTFTLSETQGLATMAAYAHWQLAQPEAAVAALEASRAQLMREAQERQRRDIEQLPALGYEELYRKYITAVQEYINLLALSDNPPADWHERINAAYSAYQAAAADIRQIAGSDHPQYRFFLQAPPFSEIQKQAAHTPLVYLAYTDEGGLALIVTSEQVVPVPLPNLTGTALHKQVQGSDIDTNLNGYLNAYYTWRNDAHNPKNLTVWKDALDEMSQWLWANIMAPLFTVLETLYSANSQIAFIPSGWLALLPLHAASDGQLHCFCDTYTIKIAPSANALRISRQRATKSEPSLFAGINPTGDLKYTQIEGEAISQMFPPEKQTILFEKEVTVAAFANLVQSHSYIHYTGHGYYDWQEPLQSGLRLTDKSYTLSDIFNSLDLSICQLVTLSACETGIIEFQKAPDEYVGLPSGFMQAGAPAVVSSLWAVDDLSTMLLMERFYQQHLQDGLKFAQALRQAQLWLRDVTAGELAERFGEERMKLKGHRLTLNEAGQYWRRFAAMEPEERPFAHPYYWAAFTFTGA